MEVLANGMKVNFWIGVEEEPDIDRFIDEQIMIDMDRFMLVGTLEKVATCKKKNEEKEYEYFKQITVQVNNICSADDNNINIAIPAKKEEFLYEVKFRYAPEPEQVTGDDMEPANAEEEEALAVSLGGGAEIERIEAEGQPEDADDFGEQEKDETTPDDDFEPDQEQLAEIEHDEAELLKAEAADEKDIVVTITKPAEETPEDIAANPGKPLVEVLDTEADDGIGEPDLDLAAHEMEEPDPADDLEPDPDDDDGINWGD
jgi:hypothetical protein